MQNRKELFDPPVMRHEGSLQDCLRTNDLELVGDGTHLTYFQMLGNFSYGLNDYELSVDLWSRILLQLGLPPQGLVVHVHPERPDHRLLWEQRGYPVQPDPECLWSDGRIGGHCCEIYRDGLEIGNLMKTPTAKLNAWRGFPA